MAKHSGKITKRIVDSWAPGKRGEYLWDGELKGYGLIASTGGGMSFVIQYRNKHGKTRRYSVGKVGSLTPDHARKTAEKLLARIRTEGYDPLEKRQLDRDALTVNDILDRYLDSARFAEKADSTQYTDKGRIKRHLRPLLGNLMAENLAPEHIRKALADIRDGKTAVNIKTKSRGRSNVKGGDGAARMAIRVLRAIINWAIGEGLMVTNPASTVKLGSDGKRSAILESPEQYRALFEALQTLEETLRLRSAAADAIRVLALTGARLSEITAIRWGQVDLNRGLLVLPAKTHKAGHRSGEVKEIPLSAAAQAVIANRPKGQSTDYVFPPKSGDGPITLSSKLWQMIRAEASLPVGITNHSLRHSLGSMMAMQGAEAAEIMAMLGHTQLSTTERYIHFARDARVALAERHTAGIAAALEGRGKAGVVDMIPTGKS